MADLSIIYSKTGKGLRARNTTVSGLSAPHIKVLSFIDGKSKAEAILAQSDQFTEKELVAVLSNLLADGYIRPLAPINNSNDDWALTSNFTPMVVEEFKSEDEIEAEQRAKIEQEKQAAARIAAEKNKEKLRWKAEIKARKEAEETRALAEAKEKAEANKKAQAIEKANAEAKEKVRNELERINREAALNLQKEQQAAQKIALQKAEEAALQAEKQMAEEKARIAAEQELARLEQERTEKIAAEIEREAQRKLDAEAKEAARLLAELDNKAKEEAKLNAALEKEAKAKDHARLEAERLARAENEAQLETMRKEKLALKAQEVAAAAKEAARLKRIDKQQADAAAKEQARLEMANIVGKAEEARKQAETAAKEARQEAKRQTIADEQARVIAENVAAEEAERARIDAEAATAQKIAAHEAAQAEMNRLTSKTIETNQQPELATLAQEQTSTIANNEEKRTEKLVKAEQEKAAIEKSEQIRAIAEADEQAVLDAKKLAQQEMARIAREADALRALSNKTPSNDSALTKPAVSQPTFNQSSLAKTALGKPTKTNFAKSRFDQSKFEKSQFEKTKSNKAKSAKKKIFTDDNFEDSYSVQENIAAKNVRIKTSNSAVIEARDAENRAKKAGSFAKISTAVQEKAKRFTPSISVGKWLAKLLKITFIYVPVFAIIGIALLHFINISPLIAPIEKLASNSLGKPVSIKQVHASLWPQPHIVLGDVAIGDNLNAPSIQVVPDLSTLFEETKSVQSLEIRGWEITQNNGHESLQLLQSLGSTIAFKNTQFSVRDLQFKLNDLVLEPMNGKLVLNAAHKVDSSALDSPALDYLDLQNVNHTLNVQIRPLGLHQPEQQNRQYDLSLTGSNWPLPLNPKLIFSELKAHGVVSQNQLDFSNIKGAMAGGNLSGKATLDWVNGWKTAGDFSLDNANASQLLSALGSSIKVDGKANLAGNFSAQASSANTLLNTPNVTTSVMLSNGKISGVDLVQAVMSNNVSLMGDATAFDKLKANLQVSNNQFQYRQIALDTKQFHANGDVNIGQDKAISGRVSANLAAQSRRLQVNFGLSGHLHNVKRQ